MAHVTPLMNEYESILRRYWVSDMVETGRPVKVQVPTGLEALPDCKYKGSRGTIASGFFHVQPVHG